MTAKNPHALYCSAVIGGIAYRAIVAYDEFGAGGSLTSLRVNEEKVWQSRGFLYTISDVILNTQCGYPELCELYWSYEDARAAS